MIRKEELKALDALGKKLEKEGKVRDFRRFNADLMKLQGKYTAQQREKIKRDENRKYEAERDEFVEKAVYYNRTRKTYGT